MKREVWGNHASEVGNMGDISIGMVGAGNWAIVRAGRFNDIEGCRVVLGWSRSESSRERFGRELDAPTLDDWRAVCTSADVDAIVVSTPHVFHFEQAQAALAGGKHVFVETPLCMDYEQALELVELARPHGLVIHHGAKWRYHPDHPQEIESLRKTGRLVYAEQTATFDGGPDRSWYRDLSLSGGGFALLPYLAVDFFEAFGEVAGVDGRHVRQNGLDVATMWVDFAGGGQAKLTYGTGEGIADVQAGLVVGTEGAVQWGTGQPKRFIKGDQVIELPGRRDVDVVLCENRAFTDAIRGTRDSRPDLELDLAILKAVTEARQKARA